MRIQGVLTTIAAMTVLTAATPALARDAAERELPLERRQSLAVTAMAGAPAACPVGCTAAGEARAAVPRDALDVTARSGLR